MNKPTIRIDIVSDVVCPWCYIGKRWLEKAISQLSDRYHFELEYQPFELNPDMPASGVNQKEYLINKFGGPDRYEQITAHTTRVAADEGLDFHFEKQLISLNTRNAHRIIGLAREEGKQILMVELFFKAYFSDGVDLSKNENLIAIAVEAGLDRKKVEKLLAGDEGWSEVVLAEKEMQRLGVTGVPFYIVNQTYGVSGAQTPDVLVKLIEEINAPVAPNGEACDVDGSNC